MGPAAAAALAAVMARGAPVVRLGQDRQPRRDDRDVQLLGRLLDQQLVAARRGRRQKNAVRLVRQVLRRSEDADQPIDLVVVRLQIVVGDRPVVAQAVERAAPEIVRSEPQRNAAPVVRAAADHPRPEPLPGVAGRVGVGLPVERPASERGVELSEVPLGSRPAAALRVVGPGEHERVGDRVPIGARFQHDDVRAGFGQDFRGHAAARARSDDAYVENRAVVNDLHGRPGWIVVRDSGQWPVPETSQRPASPAMAVSSRPAGWPEGQHRHAGPDGCA